MASAVLVTLAQAKDHLRITTPPGHPGDADIQAKLDEAEALIRKYLKAKDDPAWTAQTVPPPVQMAIKLWLGRLDSGRGDDEDNDADAWAAVVSMLNLYRKPALA